jgi:hypothetical protein
MMMTTIIIVVLHNCCRRNGCYFLKPFTYTHCSVLISFILTMLCLKDSVMPLLIYTETNPEPRLWVNTFSCKNKIIFTISVFSHVWLQGDNNEAWQIYLELNVWFMPLWGPGVPFIHKVMTLLGIRECKNVCCLRLVSMYTRFHMHSWPLSWHVKSI